MTKSRLFGMNLLVVAIALVPVITVFKLNINRLPLDHLYDVALMITLIVSGVVAALYFIPKHNEVAIWIFAIFLLYVFSGRFLFPVGDHVEIWTGVCLALLFLAIRHARQRPATASIIGFACAIHLLISFYSITTSRLIRQRDQIDLVASDLSGIEVDFDQDQINRDIYYLIFDRYGRNDQLVKHFSYDNSDFLNELVDRQFLVSEHAFANYQRTGHSLASSLNLQYLNSVSLATQDWVPLYRLIDDSNATRLLKNRGYHIYNLGSWWEPTRHFSSADQNYSAHAPPAILRIISDSSLIPFLVSRFKSSPWNFRWRQCKRPASKFDFIKSIKPTTKPRFIFGHFLVPHPPFVVDEKGSCLSAAEAYTRTRKKNYIGQLRYVNSRIVDVVDHLLSLPGPKPIIVIQADEGPWPVEWVRDEIERLGNDTSDVNWTKATQSQLQQKMAILNAVYLPDLPKNGDVHMDTPVNTIRTIFREYFRADLPPLPDKYFVYENLAHVHSFHDVTDLLNADEDVILKGSTLIPE